MDFKEYTEKAIDKLIELAEGQREMDRILQGEINLTKTLHETQIKELSDRIDKLEKQ